MKHFDVPNINTPSYWDSHQTAFDFGLRQRKYCEIIGKCSSVVELGCGLSPFLVYVDAENKTGVDFSPETIKNAQKLYPDVEYILSDCVETPFKDKEFDVSVSGEVIEHLDNPDDLIKEMERITKNMIVISSPKLEFDDPEHLWEFDEQYFKDKGFTTEVIESTRFKGRSYIFAWKKLN